MTVNDPDFIEPEPPASVNPVMRIVRTILWTLASLAVAVPASLQFTDLPDKYTGYVVAVCGTMGGVVIVVTAIVNVIEQATSKTFLATPRPPR
jgi:hypothetical protein